MTVAAAIVDAEQRVAAARAERDALLDFARRVMRQRPDPRDSADFSRGVLHQLASEAERLVLLVAGDGPA